LTSVKDLSRIVVNQNDAKAGEHEMVLFNQEMALRIGNKIVRELIEGKIMSKYRLMREMQVSSIEVVDAWLSGRYFNEGKHLPRLIEVRDKWMRAKGYGFYSKG
jgi:hypothetical protein